jgi:hypothetical protein
MFKGRDSAKFQLKSYTGVTSRKRAQKEGERETTNAGIFKQSMGARNRVGIRLSYRPARLHSLAEMVPWNRIYIKYCKPRLQ